MKKEYDYYKNDVIKNNKYKIGAANKSGTENEGNVLSAILYFPLALLWMEFAVKFAVGLTEPSGFLCTVLFTLPLALLLSILCTAFKSIKINRGISIALTAVFSVWYNVQIVYYNVFGSFLVVSSLTNGGAGQAFNSLDMIFTSVWNKQLFIFVVFIPLLFNVILGGKLLNFGKSKSYIKIILLVLAVLIHVLTVLFISIGSSSGEPKSAYNLYHGELQQNSACEKFGVFTMQRLDVKGQIFGFKSEIKEIPSETSEPQTEPPSAQPTQSPVEEVVKREPQIIETDFKSLAEKTDNKELKSLCNYFDSASPSYTNEYTGMFEGYNIIFLSAESFSKYAIDKDLTPTLYKMYSEGFQFENFYSPAWGVSTTDGEYANLIGLIPKSGVWSFSRSAKDKVSFPFTLSKMCRSENYEKVNAYHNHTYSYYDRDKYLANIGYDYFAIGKGLDLGENVWPNSDLKMMQKSVSDYVNADSFCVYYMTVSGHGGYSYNTMSIRNKEYVEDLPYSDEVKGYLAANIELDKAMEYLISELDKAGKLNNTLICLTDDHYPYALDDFNGLDELAGHKVDTVFERYENAWLLWSGSMDKPIKVDSYCSSLDILPTLLNLLGFEYDSRALSGTDVFGGKEPFVVFADRSWISQNGRYNANKGTYEKFENAKGEDDVSALNDRCSNMFTVARMILDNDAYAKIYG